MKFRVANRAHPPLSFLIYANDSQDPQLDGSTPRKRIILAKLAITRVATIAKEGRSAESWAINAFAEGRREGRSHWGEHREKMEKTENMRELSPLAARFYRLVVVVDAVRWTAPTRLVYAYVQGSKQERRRTNARAVVVALYWLKEMKRGRGVIAIKMWL